MKIDIYTKPSLSLSGPEELCVARFYLAVPQGEALPPEAQDASWRSQALGLDTDHPQGMEALDLFGVSAETALEDLEIKGYALSSIEGQVSALRALA